MRALSALSLILVLMVSINCETEISPDLEKSEPIMVVDAWLTNESKDQIIKLTYTQPYFENSSPSGVTSSTVILSNKTDGRNFIFNESESGLYRWTPANSTDSLGQTGDNFILSVKNGSEEYIATSIMGRVPEVDSITFTYVEPSGFFPEYYIGEFWARDLKGLGDTYWIKAWKNDTLLLKPSEINIAYDASFTESNATDNIVFIPPIRQAISPFEIDDQGVFIPPYKVGDSVYVEIYSITKAAFYFLNEVVIQTDRPGGFGELFASPFANVRTNIININPNGKKAVGFFNVGTVSGLGKRFVE